VRQVQRQSLPLPARRTNIPALTAIARTARRLASSSLTLAERFPSVQGSQRDEFSLSELLSVGAAFQRSFTAQQFAGL